MAKFPLFLSLLFLRLLFRAEAQPTYVNSACSKISTSNVPSLQELQQRNQFLTELFTNVSQEGINLKFYNVTANDTQNNTVYVLYQCREDIDRNECESCVETAKDKIFQECSTSNEGVVWYEECMFRYAYRDIFSLAETFPVAQVSSAINISGFPDFTQVISKSMDTVIQEAVLGKNGSHSATQVIKSTSTDEHFQCLAQCTPDLTHIQCQNCLDTALGNISKNFNRSIQTMIFFPSCQLRYSNSTFPESRSGNSFGYLWAILLITIVPGLGFALIVAVGVWLCMRRKLAKYLSKNVAAATRLTGDVVIGAMDDIRNLESLQFDFIGVETATSNFSDENKLGRGGFGEVYKGKFSNGEEIAVKRLSKNSQQGATEFMNEVQLLAKLQHRNLVKLLGFCLSGEEKILIYEFLSNSSLDRFLYDPLKRAHLGWKLRFTIITGIARGILYLHEDSRLKIIHRDLKASNILLDDAMNAKIADFGIARLFNFDQTQGDTMRISGTYGYMAPEYALAGHFSAKSDVYSFGVIVLEILSGQRNTFFIQPPDEGLIYRAWRLWNEEAILELIDPLLDNQFVEEEVRLCVRIGLLCIQEDATLRPRMASIVAALNGQSIALPLPDAPHIFTIGVATDQTSSNIDSQDSQPGNEVAHTGTMGITAVSPR